MYIIELFAHNILTKNLLINFKMMYRKKLCFGGSGDKRAMQALIDMDNDFMWQRLTFPTSRELQTTCSLQESKKYKDSQ